MLLSSAAILTLSLAATTVPSTQSGDDIYSECTAPAGEEYRHIFCYGYIDGIADAMAGNAINGYMACIPMAVGGGRFDVVIQFLRANPAKRHLAAAGLVARALSDAYPCR
jgi:hypothetical protein